MGMVFPRLDRPSAVGDDGRPQSTSLAVAGVTVFVVAVGAGLLAGDPMSVVSVGSFTSIFVAGMALLERDTFGTLFAGALLALLGGTITVGLLFVSLATTTGWVSLGLSLSLLGIGFAWVDLGASSDASPTQQLGASYVGLAVGSIGIVVAVGLGTVLLDIGRPGPTGGLAIFLFLLSVLGATAYAFLRAVPLAQLVARPRRDAVAARVTQWRKGAVVGAVVAFVSILAAPFLAPSVPPVALLGSAPIRIPLFAVVALLALVATVSTLARRLAHSRSGQSRRQLAGTGVGLLVCTLLFATGAPAAGVAIVVALLLVVPLVLLLVVGIGSFLSGTRLVPEGSGALVLASGGLAVAALGGGVAGYPPLFVLGSTAGALVVWDVSTFGTGLTAELGHAPATRDLELVHAVTVLGIGVAVVLAGTGLLVVRSSLGLVGSEFGMALAGVAALLALLPLRG